VTPSSVGDELNASARVKANEKAGESGLRYSSCHGQCGGVSRYGGKVVRAGAGTGTGGYGRYRGGGCASWRGRRRGIRIRQVLQAKII
jgi:hypothetical protein